MWWTDDSIHCTSTASRGKKTLENARQLQTKYVQSKKTSRRNEYNNINDSSHQWWHYCRQVQVYDDLADAQHTAPEHCAQWHNYNFCPPPPGKHSLRALVHIWTFNVSSNRQLTALQNVSVYRVRHTNSETFTLSPHWHMHLFYFGPPLLFWAPGPPALPGLPMASYATDFLC